MKQFTKEHMFPFYKQSIFSLLENYMNEVEVWINSKSNNDLAKGFLVTNIILDLIDFISDFIEHPTKKDSKETLALLNKTRKSVLKHLENRSIKDDFKQFVSYKKKNIKDNKKVFTKYIQTYFNDEYQDNKLIDYLWLNIRNSLTHRGVYTIFRFEEKNGKTHVQYLVEFKWCEGNLDTFKDKPANFSSLGSNKTQKQFYPQQFFLDFKSSIEKFKKDLDKNKKLRDTFCDVTDDWFVKSTTLQELKNK